MAIEIEDVKSFVSDCDTERQNWIEQAKASWREIKKLTDTGKMHSLRRDNQRKRRHYPLWYSTFRIRKPLIYGRTPQIVGQDTAYGDDPTGRTAAILIERLGQSIMKSFSFDDAIQSVRDDTLVTDLGAGRAYYACDYHKEKVKEYLQQQQLEDGSVILVDESGAQVTGDVEILTDEQGVYRLSERETDVESERVYFKHTLYSDFYVDPDATRWEDVKRVAFAWDYSERDFKETFGKDAFSKIPETKVKLTDSKRKVIRVYEYWCIINRKVCWWAEGSEDLLPKPNSHKAPKAEEGEEEKREDDLYNLQKFLPCPEPLVFNAPTDSFYPVTEYYQLLDVIDDIHHIATTMHTIMKAIRPRLLFDSSVDGLQKLINEANTADAIGVTNLSQTLSGAGGSIANSVAYLPIEQMVSALSNYYQIFQQKLESFFQLSGTSDLLQGKTDQVERTYGEQQMKAKYALNQIEPIQRDFQRYCRDVIELLCEMALKNFKDETLAEYIMPQTLDMEDQQRYTAALALLKDDKKRRFRIDIETDSTIALNEEFEKAARIEVTNALTKAVDFASQTSERTPFLAPPMIKMVRHLAGGFRQGKQFIDEIQGSFDKAAEAAEAAANQPAPEPQPDPRLEKIKSDQMIAQGRMQIEAQKLQQSAQKLQLEFQKLTNESQLSFAEFQAANQQMSADQQLEQYKLMIADRQQGLRERSEQFQQELESMLTQLEFFKAQNEVENKQADNARLSEQNQISLVEALKPNVPDTQVMPIEPSKPAPTIIINQQPNPLRGLI